MPGNGRTDLCKRGSRRSRCPVRRLSVRVLAKSFSLPLLASACGAFQFRSPDEAERNPKLVNASEAGSAHAALITLRLLSFLGR